MDRHRAAVYRVALSALGSHADAEDAAQEAFLLAYRRLGSFRGDASFTTWLLTIAWHQAINRRRALASLWRRVVVPKDAEEAESSMANLAAIDPTPEQTAAQEQLRRGIRQAIRALSPKLRDALLLAQAGDYTYEEIGAMRHAPIGTIKWRVSRSTVGWSGSTFRNAGTAMWDERVNSTIDEVAREMTAGEPDGAFAARVLARVDEATPRRRVRAGWVLAPLALWRAASRWSRRSPPIRSAIDR